MYEKFGKMYYTLFNAITDAIEQMEHQQFQAAIMTLEQAQRQTEEMFIDMCISEEEGEE